MRHPVDGSITERDIMPLVDIDGGIDSAGEQSAELARIRTRYQTLVEQIPAVLYEDLQASDGSFTATFVSPQIEAILGVTPDDYLHGEPDRWVAHLHPDDRDRARSEYERAVAGDGALEQEYRMVRDDGRVVWIRDQFTVIDESGGSWAQLSIQGVMFDITERKVAEAAAERQVELLEKVDTVGRAFTDLLLRGATLADVLAALQAIEGAPIVLEDIAHQIVELAVPPDLLDQVVEDWGAHSRSGHDAGAEPVSHGEGCFWINIQLRERAWGRLHVLSDDLDEVDQLAVDRAAAAVALTLHSKEHVAHLADHERGALISDVWNGRFVSAAEVLRRARALGADLSGTSVSAMVIEPHEASLSGDGRDARGRDRRHQLRGAILQAMRLGLASPPVTGLSSLVGDRGLLILGTPDESAARLVARQVLDSLEESVPEAAVAIGLSQAGTADELRQALSQADEAAAYGLRVQGQSGVFAFRDLGIHHLLRRLADGPELAHFVEAQLHPILDHDATSSSPLLPTLKAFLANGGRKTDTARVLHVERRSLYYRLERIEGLLGRDLDDQDVRIQLEIATRGLDTLGQRGPRT